MKKNCSRCGKEFEAERPLKRYCSDTCRQYAYLERNGLKINRPSEPDLKFKEEESPIPKSVSVNTVIDTNDDLKTIGDNRVPIKNKRKTVNSTNDTSSKQLGELMQEIKELKEEIAKNSNQSQVNQAQSNQETTFQQLLDERMKLYRGANMFTEKNYSKWQWSDFSKVKYVNERMKSYLTQLLKFHKEEQAEYRHLKSIYDKMEELKSSFDYKYLPADYPYRDRIDDFAKRLKKIIDNSNEDDEIHFRIRKSVRAEMQAMLIEIGNTVPDVDHCPQPKDPGDIRQNSYYLAHKKKGFDILKDMENL